MYVCVRDREREKEKTERDKERQKERRRRRRRPKKEMAGGGLQRRRVGLRTAAQMQQQRRIMGSKEHCR